MHHTMLACLVGPSLLLAAHAATEAAPAKPGVIEAAVTGTLGYDNNVYLVDQGPLGRVDSVVSTVGAQVGARFASGAYASYAATGSRFWNSSDEDNVKHQLAAAYHHPFEAVRVNAATEFAQIQGDDEGSVYEVAKKSSFTTPAPRERRNQLQNKTDLAVRYDAGPCFVRAAGKLQYWNMQTRSLANAENYRDRYEVSGGPDLGRTFSPGGPDYYLGYRHGYVYQDTDAVPATVNHATNQYNRFLVGVDGKVSPNLKLSAQVGWTVNEYTSSYLGSDRSIEGLYHDITASWKATAADELQLKTSLTRTVSSTSCASVLASAYQLGWKRNLNKQWSTSLTGRLAKNNYDGSSTDRNDVLYTGIAALTWNSSAALAWTLSLSLDFAKNVAKGQTPSFSDQSAFEHTLVSAGVRWKL